MSNPIPKPFASAHRAGNSRRKALTALEAGADLLETDIWLHNGQLELRHEKTMGPIPILWERWTLKPGWIQRYTLRDLLNDTPDDALLFLDFKGKEMGLGPAIVRELQQSAPNRIVATCGRNYPQLEAIAHEPNIITFYSVGAEDEWALAQPYIEACAYPALSLICTMATQDRIDWITNLGGTVVCWGVESEEEMDRLRAMGVDGFTTDRLDLLTRIRKLRELF